MDPIVAPTRRRPTHRSARHDTQTEFTSPTGALLGGAVGERGRRDQGEPAGDLPSPDPGEQALGLDVDTGIDEGGREPLGEVFELV
jgi:hypothetical protein